jgi:hypothetical protein
MRKGDRFKCLINDEKFNKGVVYDIIYVDNEKSQTMAFINKTLCDIHWINENFIKL